MDMKPKELLAEIEREEREGNTTFSSLSAELRKKIEDNVMPEIVYKGLSKIKHFLKMF